MKKGLWPVKIGNLIPLVLALALLPALCIAQTLNMTLHAQRDDYAGSYSDIWGYTAPNGDEYAIICHEEGTIFYNITDRTNPVEVGYIPGPSSIWRDIKVNDQYAFIVTEGADSGAGLQTVSLVDPENPVLVNTWDDKFLTAHNLFIDTTRSLAYVCGTNKGMHVIDISDPVNPVQTKIWRALGHYYIHDLMVANDTVWAGAVYEGRMHAIASPDAYTLTEAFSWSYAGAASHAGWLHYDHRFFIGCDEAGGGHVRIWDVSDPLDITQISSYQVGSGTSVHNIFVKGQFAFISYYTEGTRVLDVSDPYNPQEVAYYDMHPGGGLFAGNWGVFPYFKSGTIISSDMSSGLYLFTLDSFTGIDHSPTLVLPAPGTLHQNSPNPFNPTTEIGFDRVVAGEYGLNIYDVNGRMIRELFRDAAGGAGTTRLTWDGRDNAGRHAPSGTYLYRLTGPQTDEQKKMILIR